MLPTDKSKFAETNVRFRNRDFIGAVKGYEEVRLTAQEPILRQIKFNLALARKRLEDPAQTISDSTHLELIVLHQVTPGELASGQWRSAGDDPSFEVDLQAHGKLCAGWYQLELSIESHQKRKISQIYPDYGEGFSEDTSIVIVHNRQVLSTLTRVIRFKKDVARLRFDPVNHAGLFSIRCFEIKPISEKQALITMQADAERGGHLSSAYKASQSKIDDIYHLYYHRLNTSVENGSYEDWIRDVELQTLPSDVEVQSDLAQMKMKPLISVVVPAYNTAENSLRACIESVIRQSYPCWELCIADDASNQSHVSRTLDEYKSKDARIKVFYRERNGHISHASNSALAIATGDYVALLDHDDELPEHALYFIAQAVNANPNAQIFYGDEDKIDTQGRRFAPHFKSDWNPDLFFSQNYVCHLSVYRRQLLNIIKGFRTGVEGSQDHDLLLRCLPHVQCNQIIHIPRVLYHWRATEGSTALNSGEKSYTTKAGLKALRDYFAAQGESGVEVEVGMASNTYRVKWPLPEPPPMVSLLIPTRDKKEITEVAVRSILDKTTYKNFEIIILDNGSVESETLDWFVAIQSQDVRVRVIRYDYPFNYSAINNFGVKHSRGSVIGLVNNDLEVITPDWLTEMVSHASRPEIGCVGAKLYYPDGAVQHAGVILGVGGVAGHSHKHFDREASGYFGRLKLTQNLSAVTAACLVVRKEIYNAVGGLDDEHLKVAFNDVDFCLKVRDLGYRNLWSPYAKLYHHESISRGYEDTPEKQARFRAEVMHMKAKWDDALKRDPYYNPNLTKDREDFSIGLR
jgi:glycosyltransferase involved in cell wall biosynthesis